MLVLDVRSRGEQCPAPSLLHVWCLVGGSVSLPPPEVEVSSLPPCTHSPSSSLDTPALNSTACVLLYVPHFLARELLEGRCSHQLQAQQRRLSKHRTLSHPLLVQFLRSTPRTLLKPASPQSARPADVSASPVGARRRPGHGAPQRGRTEGLAPSLLGLGTRSRGARPRSPPEVCRWKPGEGPVTITGQGGGGLAAPPKPIQPSRRSSAKALPPFGTETRPSLARRRGANWSPRSGG